MSQALKLLGNLVSSIYQSNTFSQHKGASFMELVGVYYEKKVDKVTYATAHFYDETMDLDIRICRVRFKDNGFVYVELPYQIVVDQEQNKMVQVPIIDWVNQDTKKEKLKQMSKLLRKFVKSNKIDTKYSNILVSP